MRYQLNEDIFVIGYYHNDKDRPNRIITSIFDVILSPEIDWKFEIKKLTVTEHHKVEVKYFENQGKTADGYVLIDFENKVYHNQYPTASYGQTSDAGDRMFYIDTSNRNLKEVLQENKIIRYALLEEQYGFIKEKIQQLMSECGDFVRYSKMIQEIDEVLLKQHGKKMEEYKPYPDVLPEHTAFKLADA